MANVLTFLKYLRGIFKTNLKVGTVHHAVIQSIYDAFVMVDGDINLMRLEMCLSTATGKWLDYWGEFFTVPRKNGEADSAYARRIIEYVIRPKTTIPALKDYIVEFLNDKYGTSYTTEDVDIREPWKELSKYSHMGTLSNSARMYSPGYYTHATIDISTPEGLTSDLIELVRSVKAAGVQVLWSFLNSYDVISGFNESDEAWADYHRHLQTQVFREQYSGLVLSSTSPNPYLSGRRIIWKEYTSTYYWYARMLDKETDRSIIITKDDLITLLDYYEILETKYILGTQGACLSKNLELSNKTYLSGDTIQYEEVIREVQITKEMFDLLQFVDDWLTLSYRGAMSTSKGLLYNFEAPQELVNNIIETLNRFKQNNLDYYNALQPPILIYENLAIWYVSQHRNWLLDTPTMSLQDFYDLWEAEDKTVQEIYNFQDSLPVHYLTFADVYQPPIVRTDFPWYWVPIQDYAWLWDSATLTNDDLDAIYRMRISDIPDRVKVTKSEVKHLETAFTLDTSTITPMKYSLVPNYSSSPAASLALSKGSASEASTDSSGTASGSTLQTGMLGVQKLSGEQATVSYTRIEYSNVPDPKYLSGSETTITTIKELIQDTITIEDIIKLEETQELWNPNEKITYSPRGFGYPINYVQAPVQAGEYVMWLVVEQPRQLWDTPTISNIDIRRLWDTNLAPMPTRLANYMENSAVIYQPPIVIVTSDAIPVIKPYTSYLWNSQVINDQDLLPVYQTKLAKNNIAFSAIYNVPLNQLSQIDMFNYEPTIGNIVTYEETYGNTYESGNADQKKYFSSTDTYQPNIEVYEHKANVYAYPLKEQLWDAYTLSNWDILDLWEGQGKPFNTRLLKKYMFDDDTPRYQAPIQIN